MKIFITGGSGFIGTNFIEFLKDKDCELLNFDIRAPLNRSQQDYWEEGTILDVGQITESMKRFQPDVVIHLAARADTGYGALTVEEDYPENTSGTANVLEAIRRVGQVERMVITSTQFVVGPGALPENDTDYRPHTVYGESKVITEKLTREANLACWTLIRPTNVWGPYHERYTREFWNVCYKGWYIHPGVPSPVRSYAYVGNVVWQIYQILLAKKELVHQQVYYMGDEPIEIDQWIHGFFKELSPRKSFWVIPYPAMKGLALIGDLISWVTRKPFYINSSRLRSMTTEYDTPMYKTFETFGAPPFSLEEGIGQTAKWFRDHQTSGKK